MFDKEDEINEPSEKPRAAEVLHPVAEHKPPDSLARGSLEKDSYRIPLSEVWKKLHVSMTLFRKSRKRSITTV
jgi:hypothetical protein